MHLLPVFDFATIEESRSEQADPDVRPAVAAAGLRAAAGMRRRVADQDGFNWGYDPLHYTTPEGSYATDPDGAAGPWSSARWSPATQRRRAAGRDGRRLQPHPRAGQDPQSMLDRIVPGYYHRLNADRPGRELHLLRQHRDRARDDGEADGRLGRHLGHASTRSTASAST